MAMISQTPQRLKSEHPPHQQQGTLENDVEDAVVAKSSISPSILGTVFTFHSTWERGVSLFLLAWLVPLSLLIW